MLRIQQPIRTAEIKQNALRIHSLQQGICSPVYQLFSRAIQFIKDLFNKIYSCCKKPNPTPILIATNVAHPTPQIDPVLITNRILPPVVQPPVIPEQGFDFRGRPDLFNNIEWLENLFILERYEYQPRDPAVVITLEQRRLHERIVAAEARLAAFPERAPIPLDPRDRLTMLNHEEVAGQIAILEEHPIGDLLEQFRARQARLQAVILPEALLAQMRGSNLLRVNLSIHFLERIIPIFQGVFVRINPDRRERMQESLDKIYMLLHVLKERRQELGGNPGHHLIAQMPEIAPHALIMEDPNEIDIMNLEEAHEAIARHEQWVEDAIRDYQEQNRLEPRVRDIGLFARAQYKLEIADARLAALLERLAHLQTFVLPPEYMLRLANFNLAQVNEEILRIEAESLEQGRRLIHRGGEERRAIQENLDLNYAKLRMLGTHRAILARNNARFEVLPQNLEDEIDVMNLAQVNAHIAGHDAWVQNARDRLAEQQDAAMIARFQQRIDFADTYLAAVRARIEPLQDALPRERVPFPNLAVLNRHIRTWGHMVANRTREMLAVGLDARVELRGRLANAHGMLQHLMEIRAAWPAEPAQPIEQPQIALSQEQRNAIDTMNLDAVNHNIAGHAAWVQEARDGIQQQELPDERRAEFRQRLQVADLHLAALQERAAHLQAVAIPQNILDRLNGMTERQRYDEMLRLQEDARNRVNNLRNLEGEARRVGQGELDRAFAILRRLEPRFMINIED